MKPPIIVSGDDLYIFESARAAESYLEPPDVSDGLYTAYDSEGRLLRLEARKPLSRRTPFSFLLSLLTDLDSIWIGEGETEPSHQDELRKLLYQYLKRIGRHETLTDQSSLQEIIAMSVERMGYTR